MKHRWMDAVKRSTSALASSSPRAKDGSAPPSSSSATEPHAVLLSHRRGSFALSLPAISTAMASGMEPSAGSSSHEPEENLMAGADFVHFDDRCESVGECSVSKVLELCMLQGGVHHTHMNLLTYLGNPLRVDTCCYAMRVQWFRALGERDDFQAIHDACDEWFTPTADDIGAKILAKVMLQDEDAVRTKLLEYGPIKEDPEVRSKVEMYLERRSVLFMGLESVAVQDGGENYPNNIDMQESWTLLIDDRRVRLTCESSLLPPFEGFYTSSIRIEIVRTTPHEFYLFLADNCYVHLRAASNSVRDIIVLTLRAFCRSAVSSELLNDAIAKGISPMLTIRTLAAAERQQQQQQQNGHGNSGGGSSSHIHSHVAKSPVSYNLPWNRPSPTDGAILIDQDNEEDAEDDHDDSDEEGRLSESYLFSDDTASSRRRTASESLSVTSTDFYNDSVLQDAEALIGNAMKMGLQHQILPRAPKRISITDIPDLQIIEAMAAQATTSNNEDNDDQSTTRRRRQRSKTRAGVESDWRSRSSSLDVQASACFSESHNSIESSQSQSQSQLSGVPQIDECDTLDEAIQKFQREEHAEVETLRSQYVAIFCEMQRELSEYKARAKSLSQRLDEKTEENTAFRSDIATLQDALSSVQIAEKVKEMVTNDLEQLIRAKQCNSPLPKNFY